MKKLKLSTENKDIDIFPNYLFGEILTGGLKKPLGVEYPPMFCEYFDNSNRWANDIEAANRNAKKLLSKIIKNPAFAPKIIEKFYLYEKKLKNVSSKIRKEKFNLLPNEKTADLFKIFLTSYRDVLIYGWLPLGCEGFSSELSNYLKKYLDKNLNTDEATANNCFIDSTTPKKKSQRQEAELMVVDYLKKNKESQKKFIGRFLEKNAWLNFNFQGPAMEEKDVAQIIKDIKNRKEQKKKKTEWLFIEKNPLYKRMFETARELMYLKNRKQEALFYSHYCLENLLKELGRRNDLSLKEIRSMTADEIMSVIKDGNIAKKEIARRSKKALFIFSKGNYEIITDGMKINEFIKNHVSKGTAIDMQEIKGQVASSGQARGIVKVVNSIKDMSKMKKGDILVSSKTNPNFMPVIRKAAAIITDYGGITCHAAIVARELKIPCIIGTKVATKILKDGMIVEVDANNGVVKILK